MATVTDWPDTLVATHSGLRGRPGIDLTPEVVERVVRSFATLLRERDAPNSVGVARDGRPEGDELAVRVVRLVLDTGFDAVDLGEISTPTAKLAARLGGLGGAIVVTASHLGPGWNGLKLIAGPNYLPIDIRMLRPLPEAPTAASPGRLIRHSRAVSDHADALCASVDAELIGLASLTVSCGGGVGGLGAVVVERLGCAAAANTPDVSFLLDPDGDRLQLVDEHGTTLDPEVVLPLVTLATGARHVVKGADTSRMVDAVVARNGGTVSVVAPGELHLVEELLAVGADVAGEGNGGVVVPSVGLARDGLAAAAAILELLARSQRPLSDLAAELPDHERRRWTIPCAPPDRAAELLTALAGELDVPAPDDAETGIAFDSGEAWALVRRSATEHLLRVTVEGRDAAAADSLQRRLERVLRLA